MEKLSNFLKASAWFFGIATIVIFLVALSFTIYEGIIYPHTSYTPLVEKARNFAALGMIGLLWFSVTLTGVVALEDLIKEKSKE